MTNGEGERINVCCEMKKGSYKMEYSRYKMINGRCDTINGKFFWRVFRG
jgi:hypothetical protein